MKKKWTLPVVAGITLIVAVLVVLLIPGNLSEKNTGDPVDGSLAKKNPNGDIVIQASDLSEGKVSFLRIADDSKIELLAGLNSAGSVSLALGTCQSCNGSPNAYYIQKGDRLICNNCGQSFPLSVIASTGGGCRPIPVQSDMIETTENGIIVNTASLMEYETLFEKVSPH